MSRKRYRKIPVCDLFGGCIGYECPEKEIRIVECDKEQADRCWSFLQWQYPGIVHIRDGEQLKFVKYL